MPKTKKIEKQTAEKKSTQKKSTKVKSDQRNDLLIPVYDPSGSQKGTVEFPKELFVADVNPKLLAQYVRVYLTNQRQGTASTKTRSEVKGSTRKIYRQKGTGRARHGDIKAPIFVGGGVANTFFWAEGFKVGKSLKDRKYLKMSQKLLKNKKQIRKAFLYSLSSKLKEKGIVGLSNLFKDIEPKTKNFYQFLKSLDLTKEKILLVFPKLEKENVVRAARNLPNVEITSDSSLNAYIILKNNKLFLFEDSLKMMAKQSHGN
ncbi:50S ribosomal protein L4 [Candidatus Roizmanbacteria bacterium]|nr:50S ribosomal protein L4 [Candidatus Roizmanbacteria bacterium]